MKNTGWGGIPSPGWKLSPTGKGRGGVSGRELLIYDCKLMKGEYTALGYILGIDIKKYLQIWNWKGSINVLVYGGESAIIC